MPDNRRVADRGLAGAKYACASTVFAVPVKGVSLQRTEELVMQQLGEVASHGVEDWELSRIKKVLPGQSGPRSFPGALHSTAGPLIKY